jgi:hypothetical protein
MQCLQRHLGKFLTVTAAIALPLFAIAPAARAFTINENPNNGTVVRQSLLNSLLGDQTGLSNFSLSLTGDRRAFGSFSDDPFGLGSGMVMSTGKVSDLNAKNTDDGSTLGQDLSTDFGAKGVSGDSATMTIRFDAANTVDNLFFQYVFGSEEFVEYGGSKFNDAFTLKLNGANYARLRDGSEANINNLAPTPYSYNADLRLNPVGTGPAANLTRLDGYTFPLLFTAPVLKGQQNVLTLNIQDINDGILDSAIFIKGGTISSKAPAPILINDAPYAGLPEPIGEPGGGGTGGTGGTGGGGTGGTGGGGTGGTGGGGTGGTGGTDPNLPTPALLPGLLAMAARMRQKMRSAMNEPNH